MFSTVSRLMATLALSLGLSAANAAIVNQDFSIQWNDGLDAGTTSQGSFSYDDTLAASAVTWSQLAGFSFDFRGTSISKSDVGFENMPYIESQVQALLGGAVAGDLTFSFHQAESYSYYTVSAGGPLSLDLPYSTGTWQLASPVPEPGAAGMMLAGVVVLGAMAKRRKNRN